jgi:hypothetical protein
MWTEKISVEKQGEGFKEGPGKQFQSDTCNRQGLNKYDSLAWHIRCNLLNCAEIQAVVFHWNFRKALIFFAYFLSSKERKYVGYGAKPRFKYFG